jgi:hypothetical protein
MSLKPGLPTLFNLNSQHLTLRELWIDRAYLTSNLVRQHDDSLTI